MTVEEPASAAIPPVTAPASDWRWGDLPTAEQAEAWEKVAPGTFARIMSAIEAEDRERQIQNRHERIMDWIDVGFRAVGLLCSISAVIAFIFLARYFVEKGAATQAVGILGGAAGIVGVFAARHHKLRQF